MSHGLFPYEIRPFIVCHSSHTLRFALSRRHHFSTKSRTQINPTHLHHHSNTQQDDVFSFEGVEIIAEFKSSHNYIRVVQVSRRSDHPFAGSRLLLLDTPGNIHSVSFLFNTFTNTYFDVFATLPPILPPGGGTLGILGFGAGTAARLMLELYPELVIHGWELDPSVISVGREYFDLAELEKEHSGRVFINIGNALEASIADGFSGIVVDLFSKGRLIPQLQEPETWETLRKCLRKDGRIMVNVGGSCVEAEGDDSRRDHGRVVMQATLAAMQQVFGDALFVLDLGNGKDDDSYLALTGELPNLDVWRDALPRSLRHYADMWTRFQI